MLAVYRLAAIGVTWLQCSGEAVKPSLVVQLIVAANVYGSFDVKLWHPFNCVAKHLQLLLLELRYFQRLTVTGRNIWRITIHIAEIAAGDLEIRLGLCFFMPQSVLQRCARYNNTQRLTLAH